MKKLLTVLSILVLIPLLFSCGSSDRSRDIREQLKVPFEYKIQTDEFEFTYKKEPEKVTMTVTNPSTLEGLVLEKTTVGISASYDGLVVTLPATASAKLFALDTLVDTVIKAIEDKAYTTSSKDGLAVLTVTDGDFVYNVYVDGKTDKLTAADVIEGEHRITYTFVQ